MQLGDKNFQSTIGWLCNMWTAMGSQLGPAVDSQPPNSLGLCQAAREFAEELQGFLGSLAAVVGSLFIKYQPRNIPRSLHEWNPN